MIQATVSGGGAGEFWGVELQCVLVVLIQLKSLSLGQAQGLELTESSKKACACRVSRALGFRVYVVLACR